jgi:hypothetical protein
MGEERKVYKVLVGKPEATELVSTGSSRNENNRLEGVSEQDA